VAAEPGALQPAAPAAGGSTHVVRAGESLWSIARDLLGGAAVDAQVAALVERLWTLNAGHIPSGDPDVIPVGLELIVPDLSPSTEEESR
jgi:nucleoid-associated protein YgaU